MRYQDISHAKESAKETIRLALDGTLYERRITDRIFYLHFSIPSFQGKKNPFLYANLERDAQK